MSSKFLLALVIAAVFIVCVPVLAQTEAPEESETYRLLRDSSTAEAELELTEEETSFHRWVPTIKQGTFEVSFSLGFLNLDKTLLQHDQIIYKYTQEDTYFGDVELRGSSSFNPIMRMGGNISRWFALEGVGGLSFGEFTSEVTNRKMQKNEAGAPIIYDPPLGEFDEENGSLLTGQLSLNAVVYPFSITGERISIWQPYLTGGVGQVWYSMNSNYTAETASAWDVNAGLGLRILADRNISVRLEVLTRFHELDWNPPPEFFTDRNEGTVQVPLEEWPEGEARKQVTAYETNMMTLFNWSIGVQGSF